MCILTSLLNKVLHPYVYVFGINTWKINIRFFLRIHLYGYFFFAVFFNNLANYSYIATLFGNSIGIPIIYWRLQSKFTSLYTIYWETRLASEVFLLHAFLLIMYWRSVTVAFLSMSRCCPCHTEGVHCGGGAGWLDHFTLFLFHHEPTDPPQYHLDPDSFFRPKQSYTGIILWTLQVTKLFTVDLITSFWKFNYFTIINLHSFDVVLCYSWH